MRGFFFFDDLTSTNYPKYFKKCACVTSCHEFEMIYRCKCVAKIMQIQKMRRKRHAVLLVEMRNAYKIVVGKPEGKRTFSKARHRWEDRIKWILKKEV